MITRGLFGVPRTLVIGFAALAAVVAATAFVVLDHGSSAQADPSATVIVRKTTNQSGSMQAFTVNLNGPANFSGSVTDATDFTFSNVPLGTYTLSELLPPGWNQVAFMCADSSSNQTFTLNNGDVKDCTFTNMQTSTVGIQPLAPTRSPF